jgi:hypothetical protein
MASLGVMLKNDAAWFFNFGTANSYPCGVASVFLNELLF